MKQSIPPQETMNRKTLAVGILVVILSGGLYLFTLAPTVTSEDSGELIAAAHVFGIPHPPGYPLWTILCGIFMRLFPFGNEAYKANLFSAICTSLAMAPLLATLIRLGVTHFVAGSCVLIWACSRTLWTQSVITEVYGLHALLISIALWCTVRWYGSRNHKWLHVLFGILGLGMANHHTIAFVALALICFILFIQPAALMKPKRLGQCGLVFVLGLLPYVYLPIRAAADPSMNWGNPSNATRLWRHVSRHQYGATAPLRVEQPRSITRFARQSTYVAGIVANDLSLPLALVSAGGVMLLIARRKDLALLVLFWVLSNSVLFLLISNIDLDRTFRHAMKVFFIPITLVAIIPLAVLLNEIFQWITRVRRPRVILFTMCIIILLPLVPAYSNFDRCNYADYWYAEDHGRNMLASMLPGALVIPSGDHNTFPLVYLTLVAGERPDVTIADKYGYVDPSLIRSMAQLRKTPLPIGNDLQLKAWLIRQARRPVYYTTRTPPPVDRATFEAVGLIYYLLPEGKQLERDACWNDISYRNHTDPTVIDFGASCILFDFHFFSGLRDIRLGNDKRALAEFSIATRFADGIKESFNNVGSALADHGKFSEAIPYFREASRLGDRYLTPRRNLVRTLERLGRLAETKEVLVDILRIDPTDDTVRRRLNVIQEEEH